MKTLAELKAIRDKMQPELSIRLGKKGNVAAGGANTGSTPTQGDNNNNNK